MSMRILVVDDERNIQWLLRACLEHFGCTVDTASSGEEAVAKLAEATYGGVLLDFMMPGGGMDGLAVLGLIRQSHPTLPVVIMSGHPASEVALPAFRAGAQFCLFKPFDISQLKRVIEAWIKPVRTAA